MRLQFRLIYLLHLRKWKGFLGSSAFFSPFFLANSFQNCWDSAQRGCSSDTRDGLGDTRDGLGDTRDGLGDTRDRLGDTRDGLGALCRGSGRGRAGSGTALHTPPARTAPLPAGAGTPRGDTPWAPGQSRGRRSGAEGRLCPAGLPINCPAPGAAASRGVELRGGEKRHLSPQGRFEK